MPFDPAQFAVTEQDLSVPASVPAAPMPGFASQFAVGAGKGMDLAIDNPDITDPQEYSADILNNASDDDLQQGAALGQNPEALQDILFRFKQDADKGEFSSLSNPEKVVIASMVLAPIIGGLLGKDEGALAGAAAAGRGMAAWGQQTFEQEKLGAKRQAEMGKLALARGQALDKKEQKGRDTLYKLQDSFKKNKIVREYDDVERQAQKVIALASRSGSGVADTATIFAFMRFLDPASVVREGEVESMKRAQGIQGQIDAFINRFGNASVLTEQARNEMKSIVKETMNFYGYSLAKEAEDYRTMATQQGLNPDDLLPPDYAENRTKSFDALTDIPTRPGGTGEVARPAPPPKKGVMGGAKEMAIEAMGGQVAPPQGDITTRHGAKLYLWPDGKYRTTPPPAAKK